MTWQRLDSSNLTEARYDDGLQKLEIRFRSGKVYTYPDVPREIYDGLMASDSAGQFFHKSIKGAFGGGE